MKKKRKNSIGIIHATYSEIERALVMSTHLTPTAPIAAAKSVLSQQIDQNRKLITEEANPWRITQLLRQHHLGQSAIQHTVNLQSKWYSISRTLPYFDGHLRPSYGS